MVDQEILLRNEHIIGQRLTRQLDYTISKGNEHITNGLNGILYIMFAPTINMIYKTFAKSIIRTGSRKQIRLLLDTAKMSLINNLTIDECIDRNYREFQKTDPILDKLKKGHKNYEWMVQATKRKFIAQVNPIIQMLQCEDDVVDYNDLGIKTFRNQDNAKKIMVEQLDIYKECILKIDSDSSILDVPIGHEYIVSILKKVYKDNMDTTVKGIDKIFYETTK